MRVNPTHPGISSTLLPPAGICPDELHHRRRLPGNSIWRVFTDRNGVLWVVSNGDALSRFDGGSFVPVRSDQTCFHILVRPTLRSASNG